MNVDHYTYRVTWSPEDDEHVGLCAEFPSPSWLAATPEAALAGIRKVVAGAARYGSRRRCIARLRCRRRRKASA